MNYKKYSLIILIPLSVMVSCNNANVNEQFTYYESGKIKEHYVFPDKASMETMSDYSGFRYEEDGSIHTRWTFRNGKIDGEAVGYHPSGRIFVVQTFKDGVEHGVTRIYDAEGKPVYRCLHFGGVQVIIEEWQYAWDYNVLKSHLYPDPECFGQLVFTPDGKLVEEKSYYYTLSAPDTIDVGKIYPLHIEMVFGVFGVQKHDIYVDRAVFGDFDTTFIAHDRSKFTYLKSHDNKLTYSFLPQDSGRQFVVGVVNVKDREDSTKLNYDFIVFKDFYVKPKD